MKIDFEWHDDYSIGIEEIDVQHKRFLKIVNRLYELKGKSIGDKEVIKLLDELTKYAAFHFLSEESLMDLYAYPNRDSQIKEHNKIKSDLKEKVDKIKRLEEDPVQLIYFLMKWFIDHTNYADKAFGEYMKKYSESIYGIEQVAAVNLD